MLLLNKFFIDQFHDYKIKVQINIKICGQNIRCEKEYDKKKIITTIINCATLLV